MSDVIPQGWQEYLLEDCVEVLDSLRVPVNNAERQSRIEGKPVEQLYPYYGATGQVGLIDDFLFDEELVALGEDGVPFLDPIKSKAYMLRGKTWVNNHAHVLRGFHGVALNKFVFYYLNQFDYQGYVNGGTRLKLTQANMRIIPIPLPPLAEQTRIAAKLDELLAQVDTLKARIDGIPALLKRFRQSVLAAAVSGRLTEEWREANSAKTARSMLDGFTPLPPPPRYKSRSEAFIQGVHATAVGKPAHSLTNAWEWVPLVQIARMESGHTPSRENSEYWGGDIPWIGIRDARENHEKTIFETTQKTNALGLENSAARLLPENTVCISRTASVGYVVKMGRPMATSQDFVNWVPTKYVNPDWLKWLFVAERESLYLFGKGTTHTTVYFPEWLSMHIALPHIDEQTEIVRRVGQLFTFADQLEARVVAAKSRIDHLTQSILAKAFRGELVPQDPSDEPASLLLERIKAQRAAAPKAKRGRKASA